jgi:NhaP-type Na+/H+ or K+/H+ antiporter
METISLVLLLGLIFFLGALGGFAANRLGLPKVSGYVVVGIALSPTVTGVISEHFLRSATVIVDFALAMVAYSLGGHLCIEDIKKRGKIIGMMTVGQGVGAFLFVAAATAVFTYFYFPGFQPADTAALALLFGALSVSTAPAAVLATVHEYRAKGSFTTTLLTIVAVDDALGLI